MISLDYWFLLQVPITTFLLTQPYFLLYHAVSNMTLRRLEHAIKVLFHPSLPVAFFILLSPAGKLYSCYGRMPVATCHTWLLLSGLILLGYYQHIEWGISMCSACVQDIPNRQTRWLIQAGWVLALSYITALTEALTISHVSPRLF